jgi:hypothetical protein
MIEKVFSQRYGSLRVGSENVNLPVAPIHENRCIFTINYIFSRKIKIKKTIIETFKSSVTRNVSRGAARETNHEKCRQQTKNTIIKNILHC